MASRNDRCHSRAHWTFAHLKFSFTAYQCGIANLNTRDIGDRVKLSRRSFKRNPQIARPNDIAFNTRYRWQSLYRLARGAIERDYQEKHTQQASIPRRHHPPSINYQRSGINSEGFRDAAFSLD
jgi:hypothetical protein